MEKPNILFLVIDSLRADRCYGPEKTSITPNLDYLLKNGTYFTQCISSSDSTVFSLASIFTGLSPPKTGIIHRTSKISPDVETFLKVFKSNDYHLYATIPKFCEYFGFFSDFEKKDTWYDATSRLFNGLGEKILETISSISMSEPWFYFIHLLDLHKPVILPKEYADIKFGASQYEQMLSGIDIWIGKFLKKIDLDNTIIIITADHGEYVRPLSKELSFESSWIEKLKWQYFKLVPKSLQPFVGKLLGGVKQSLQEQRMKKIKDKGLTQKQRIAVSLSRLDKDVYLYDDVIRIPLFFVGNRIPKNKIISQQVGSLDIFQTLIDIIGIKSETIVDGISLKPTFSDQNIEKSIYIQGVALQDESETVIGIRNSRYKYFRNLTNSKIHLYDLQNDPLEEKNIADEQPDLKIKLEKMLIELKDQDKNITQENMDAKEKEEVESELRKLGYL